jgi:hypothetical protein
MAAPAKTEAPKGVAVEASKTPVKKATHKHKKTAKHKTTTPSTAPAASTEKAVK